MKTDEQIKEIRQKIIDGLHRTYEKLLEMKRKNNSVIVISENGKIVKIKPEKE